MRFVSQKFTCVCEFLLFFWGCVNKGAVVYMLYWMGIENDLEISRFLCPPFKKNQILQRIYIESIFYCSFPSESFLFHLKYRTKEQLGYVVQCSPRVTYRINGFCFIVQSSKYNPVYLLGRIENFINGLEEMLVSIQVQCSSFLYFCPA